MIFGLVRMKVSPACPKIASIVVTALLSGLLVSIPATANAAACNPTSTTVGGETVSTFLTVGTCDWEVPNGVINARVLVVGGGSSGGAGVGGLWWPQGGGGGAVVDQSSFAITPGDGLSVIVGAGGAAIATQGTASTSVNNGGQSRFGTITANGGSAPNNTLAPGGTSGNGNLGGQSAGQYISGGGGGAGGGANLTTGGVGVNSNISGTTLMYGSGGSGSNGSTGATGLAGSRGETGTVGPSEVTDISIPSWTLQTATAFGFATSSGFGLLKAGKSYQFSIQIWGTTNSADSPYGLELLTSSGAAPSYFYTIMPYRYAMASTTSNKFGFSVIGTIVVGETDVSLSVKIVDAVGDTTTKPMVLTGKALITLVGAVL